MAWGGGGVGAAGAGFLVMQDANNVLQNRKPLEEGARAETAEEPGTVAKELGQEPSRCCELTILRQGRSGAPRWTGREEGGQGRRARGPHEALLGTKGGGGGCRTSGILRFSLRALTARFRNRAFVWVLSPVVLGNTPSG